MRLFDKPEVIILKDSSDAKNYLAKLEGLRNRINGNADLINKLDREIAITKAGIYGEDSIMYELKNSGLDLVVLQDIFIESPSGLTAQLDYYIITRYVNVIVECKNLLGNIEINSKGDFIRTFEYGGRKYKEGIYSPITQNERHMRVLKESRKADKGLLAGLAFEKWFDQYNKSLIILSNPKTVVNDRFAQKAVKEKVYRVDQLAYLLNNMKSDLKSSKKEMVERGNRILALNKEERKDYFAKFKALEDEVNDSVSAVNNPDSSDDRICPKCGKKLVLRISQKGNYKGNRFWGCTGYPGCKYIENFN